MRLLTIGYALPQYETDNHSIFNAPSWFDYEAVLIDPAAFTAQTAKFLAGEEYLTHDDRPVINGASTPTQASAGEHLQRRADEAARLLDAGGLIVVFGRPNATQPGLIGFEGLDRYFWLPAPAGMHWGSPVLRAAEGKTVRIVAEDSPFAGILRDYRQYFAYRAIFDGNNRAVRQHGRVIAAGGSDVPIAVQFRVLSGTVLFLPALSDDITHERSVLAERTIDAARQLLRQATPSDAPYWTGGIDIPGLNDRSQELGEANAALEDARKRSEEAQAKVEALAVHRRLVTDDGRSLTAAVGAGLELLGFAVTRDEEGRLSIEDEGQTALVECEGSRDEVVEWPYVRLQRRLEERLLKQGELLHGVVIANGFRGQELGQRPRQFTDALRIACQNYRFCLVTGETLLDLVRRALAGLSDSQRLGLRRRILAAAGHLDTPHATGEAVAEPSPEPIF